MARQRRIEYEGAFYHVLARGNRRERIIDGTGDAELFCKTLAEVCLKTGWRVHACVPPSGPVSDFWQLVESRWLTPELHSGDSYGYSSISQLYATGLAIGSHTLFDGSGTDLGSRAFAWTPEDGAFDLASTVAGGISAAGWSKLTSANFANPLTGAIIGYRTPTGNPSSQAVFVATPEPGSAALLALGTLGLLARRRRS